MRSPLLTAVWFLIMIAGFELAIQGLKRVPRWSQSHALTYFDYGNSIETKLRPIAADPALPVRHVFNAGWLDLALFPPAGESCDIAIYGMSFARGLAHELETLRPSLRIREFAGPGVPLSHSYAAYRMDVARRQARVVVVPLLSDGIPYLRTMTHDTRESDHSQPVFWPRYAVKDGRALMVGESVINSAADLRRALLTDRALWRQQLDVLAAHDDYYDEVLYASHWTEQLASLRLVRRAISHSRAHARRDALINGAGFIPSTETAQLTRVLLQQYLREIRQHGETPIVVLFDSAGEAHWLSRLVGDVLERERVAVVRSEDHCDAAHRENFTADGHYTEACNRAIAEQFLELFEQSPDRHLALDEAPARRER